MRLTSAELRGLANPLVPGPVAIRSLALHLAAVEAEREEYVSKLGARNAYPIDQALQSERDHYRNRTNAVECKLAETGRELAEARVHLDRIEGALTDAGTVPVHSDALWLSVQKLTEERDRYKSDLETIGRMDIDPVVWKACTPEGEMALAAVAELDVEHDKLEDQYEALRANAKSARLALEARIAELEALVTTARDNALEEAARVCDAHGQAPRRVVGRESVGVGGLVSPRGGRMTRRITRVYLLIDDEGDVYRHDDCNATPLAFERRSDARDYARDTNASFPDLPRLRVVRFERVEP